MGSMSIWHWAIVLIVVLVLFGGGGKITTIMGDMARGIKSFKKNLADEDHDDAAIDSKKDDASFHNEEDNKSKVSSQQDGQRKE